MAKKKDDAPAEAPAAEAPKGDAPNADAPEEPKADGGKKDSADQVKAAPNVGEVLKAYGKLEGDLPKLKAGAIRSTRVDDEGAIIAVTDHGQKLVVSGGVCTITTGPGHVPEGGLLEPVE